jgi:hypothetical protein
MNSNHLFKLFCLGKPLFNINKDLLKNNYIQLLKYSHPDFWSYSDFKKQKINHDITCHINDSFTLLNNDISRGKYLLKLNNYNFDNVSFRYIYTTNKEINDFFEKHLFLDDEIEIYTKYNMKYELKKIYQELQVQYKVHYNEIQMQFDENQYTMASYHLHLLHNIKNRINKIKSYLI